MKKTFLILAAGLLLTGCVKTVEFDSYVNDGKYSATYDSKVWSFDEERNQLVMKTDDACYVKFDAGGKGLMGTDFTSEDGENGTIITKEAGSIIWVTKKIGDTENPTLVQIIPAISENQEACIKAGYVVLETIK